MARQILQSQKEDPISAMADSLRVYNTFNQGQGGGQGNAFQDMMMLSMAKNMSPAHLAGGLTAKLLNQLFADWKDKYEARGDLKNLMQTKGAEETQKWIDSIMEKDPRRGAYLQNFRDERFPQYAQDNAGSQQTATQDQPFDSMKQVAGILNSPDSGEAFNKALNTARDWEKEYQFANLLPQVNSPF